MIRALFFCFFSLLTVGLSAQTKLTGTVIGSQASGTNNAIGKAFDGSTSTYFQAKAASNGWVGLDLGTPHVITKVGWAPAANYTANTKLAVFEGANRPDFADAVPLFMSTTNGVKGQVQTADVTVTRAFRYVRYVSPSKMYCRVSEVQFYGEEGEGSDALFYQVTNLPLVVIHTESGVDPAGKEKEDELRAIFAVINKDGTKVKEDSGTVRLRGNTSLAWEKKPYRMKFANKTKLCGSPAKAKKWVLINSWDDKTLMRNNVAFEVSRRVGMEYTPFCVPVDVMVNGEYKGTYDLADQVDQHKNRVDIESLDSTVVAGDSITGGYLIENDGNYYKEEVYFKTTNKNNLVVKYPDEDDINDAQFNYIKNHFQTMEDRLYAKDFTEDGYRRYLDMESFNKYFILEEFVGNPDAFWSTYFYKHRGDERFYTGPGWDFNLAFDNDYRLYHTSTNTVKDSAGVTIGTVWEPGWVFEYKVEGGITAGDMLNFVDLIVKQDPETVKELKAMWTNLRGTGQFSAESILAYVDEQAALLDASQTLNYMRWNVLGTTVFHNPSSAAYTSYSAAVDSLKSYIRTRVRWFDQKLGVTETTQQVTISDAGWATLYAPFAFEVPEQMSVFSVVGIEDQQLVFDTVRVAEANKPYLLFAEKGDYELTGYLTDTIATATNGLLTGTAYGMDAPAGSYVLQKQNGQLGFYKVNDNTTIRVGAGKAFLTLPAAGSASPYRAFVFDPEGALGITEIGNEASTLVYVYDIAGNLLLTIDKGVLGGTVEQRIMHSLGQGMYVVHEGDSARKVVLTR